MPGYKLSARSLANLARVHPLLAAVVHRAIELTPIDFAVIEGVRSLYRQRRLVAVGSSQTMHSKHLLQPDGYAHAVDVMAVGDLDGDGDIDAQDRSRTWDREIYTQIAGAFALAAAELGASVRWGGTFRNFFDGCHFEIMTDKDAAHVA